MIQFGIDRFEEEKEIFDRLRSSRVGLVAHPASVDSKGRHSLDVLIEAGINITACFGPQHGMRGEKQYNMIESEDYVDPIRKVPVFSLYGETRRPTSAMLQYCDGVVVDLQDLGCRIYTYLTTLVYMMEACATERKFLVLFDRPNPAGRVYEGSILEKGQESFVGVGPILMRHGATLGEMALWAKEHFKLDLDLRVVQTKGNWLIGPGFGWPLGQRAWINPSPNAPTLSMARAYSGTVLLEGTHLSEGRGTTRPLEVFGAPGIDGVALLKEVERLAPDVFKGCLLRPMYFEPTFYKFSGQLCGGFQIHTDFDGYSPENFKPYRLIAVALKAVRKLYPDFLLYRDFKYEYVFDRLAFDVITGGTWLRSWIEDTNAEYSDLDRHLSKDEELWRLQIQKFLMYT